MRISVEHFLALGLIALEDDVVAALKEDGVHEDGPAAVLEVEALLDGRLIAGRTRVGAADASATRVAA